MHFFKERWLHNKVFYSFLQSINCVDRFILCMQIFKHIEHLKREKIFFFDFLQPNNAVKWRKCLLSGNYSNPVLVQFWPTFISTPNALSGGESRLTHPVPNNFSQPSVSFEVAFESNSLAHNHGGQGLYGNCQITCNREKTQGKR